MSNSNCYHSKDSL